MMVHRVGETLLIEDFDVHKHLLRKQEDDWTWLRKFFFETILQEMQQDDNKVGLPLTHGTVKSKRMPPENLSSITLCRLYFAGQMCDEKEQTERSSAEQKYVFEIFVPQVGI